jgi:hypothetical protein
MKHADHAHLTLVNQALQHLANGTGAGRSRAKSEAMFWVANLGGSVARFVLRQ